MAKDSASIQVEQVVDRSAEGMTCVIRCMSGVVSPGMRIVGPSDANSCEFPFSAIVCKIWRYGKEVGIVDAPHGALIEIDADAGNFIDKGSILCVLGLDCQDQ